MTDAPPPTSVEPVPNTTTPGRCFRGAAISGGLAFVLYGFTQSIIRVLAGVPIPNKSVTAANISIAVRTLVVGMSTLATAIFAIAALGLVGLGIQLLIKERQPKQN